MQTANLTSASNKNYGIEILRIIAIVSVVTLHVVTFGGILTYTNFHNETANYIILSFLKIAAYGCVDLFALISGFVCINTKWASKRFLKLWLCVVFWGVTLLLVLKYVPGFFDFLNSIFKLVIPNIKETFPDVTVTGKSFFDNIFTIGTRQYWYFNMYTILLLFMPILNAAIQKLKLRQMAFISFALYFLSCVYKTICDRELFAMSGGYSAMWLIILYFIGATVRKFFDSGFSIKKWICAIGYFVSVFITFTWNIGFKFLAEKYPDVEFYKEYDELLLSYLGPFVVLSCIFLLLFFMQVNVKHNFTKKVIDIFARASFGCYIVHVHYAFWDYYLPYRFYKIADEKTFLLIVYTILAIVIFYLICTLLETIRILIFKYTRFDKLINIVGDGIDKVIYKVFMFKKDE